MIQKRVLTNVSLDWKKRQISYFEEGKLELYDLIGNLIFLRDALINLSPEWERNFTEKILDLESISSYILLVHNIKEYSDDDKKIVKQALEEIKKIVEFLSDDNKGQVQH